MKLRKSVLWGSLIVSIGWVTSCKPTETSTGPKYVYASPNFKVLTDPEPDKKVVKFDVTTPVGANYAGIADPSKVQKVVFFRFF